jgi:hypothetical protein
MKCFILILFQKLYVIFFVLAHEGKEHVQGWKNFYNTPYGGDSAT